MINPKGRSKSIDLQADGNNYYGNGVVPDVITKATIEDKMEIPNTQRQTAIKLLDQ